MVDKKELTFGLIGSGFMGRTHAVGIATANRVFDLPVNLKLKKIADASEVLAKVAGNDLGVDEYTGNWRDLLFDQEIDVINITAPNIYHKEMALESIAAGKHVYCEKPLAVSPKDAEEMVNAAQNAGVKTQVGFNYICNPMLTLAQDLILSGAIGEVYGFRGLHAEDYMAQPSTTVSWRHDVLGGGALADLGSHIIATAEYLVGPIEMVLGHCETKIDKRLDLFGKEHLIEVDDITKAFVKFENGASGSIEANWIASGRKMQHDFEVYGSDGAIFFTQERLNELKYYSNKDKVSERGFKTICAGPEHPPYDRFCVAPGHQLGFGDLKAIEVNGFVRSICGLETEPFNFGSGYRVQRLVDLIQKSSKEARWLKLDVQ